MRERAGPPSVKAMAATADGPSSFENLSISARLNLLRAGVLGANDGIVSVAGVVVGVAATTSSVPVLATAGGAALVAGALSMAAGEYVSVSTQRDTEKELGYAGRDLTNPWQAAIASVLSFAIGGLLPVSAALLTPTTTRVPVTFVAVVIALITTGWTSATLGKAPRPRAVFRTVVGGVLAMSVTYGIGSAVGVSL